MFSLIITSSSVDVPLKPLRDLDESLRFFISTFVLRSVSLKIRLIELHVSIQTRVTLQFPIRISAVSNS